MATPSSKAEPKKPEPEPAKKPGKVKRFLGGLLEFGAQILFRGVGGGR